jgi:hypothetical protein
LILKFLVGALILGFAPALAAARPQMPFAPPNGFALYTFYPGAPPFEDSATTPGADWHITTYAVKGAVGTFAPFQQTGPGTWVSTQPWADITVSKDAGGWALRIRQDGAHAACLTPHGQPSEDDLLVEPDGAAVNTALYRTKMDFPHLGALSSLNVSGVFTLNEGGPSPGLAPCRINHAGAVVKVTLIDDAVQPKQIFWYALRVGQSCTPDAGQTGCRQGPQITQWYWNGTNGNVKDKDGNIKILNYGLTDVMGSFGQALAAPGVPMPLSLDLLPQLTALINGGQPGIDTNLSDWRLAGFSYGQALWGNTVLDVTWRDMGLSWTVK